MAKERKIEIRTGFTLFFSFLICNCLWVSSRVRLQLIASPPRSSGPSCLYLGVKFIATTGPLLYSLYLYILGCTAPDVPTEPSEPSEPVTSPPGTGSGSGSGSSGGSSEGSGFCADKADGLYPVADDRNAFWHCSHGITYQQHCQAGLVFDTSCTCCNWPWTWLCHAFPNFCTFL